MNLVLQASLGAGIGLAAGAIIWRRKVREVSERWRPVADWAEIAVLVGLVLLVVVRSLSNAASPVPWDYPVFYTVAHNAASGDSFYDPEALRSGFAEVQAEWGVPDDWLVEPGFWYSPETALYLAPFGFLEYPVALVVNDLVQMVFFAGAIFLLHRAFPLRPGWMGFVDMAVLGLLFRPVLGAFDLSQIVFGALLALVVALIAVERKGWLAGVALGVGTMFKHLLLIPAVLALAIRKWRIGVGALIAISALSVGAGAIFGFDVFSEYLAFGAGDRSPELALDPVIQSLNGELRRILGDVPSAPGALEAILYPPYLLIGAVLTAVTCVVCWRASLRQGLATACFALITILALITYPNTLYNTLPLMLPALVVLISQSERLGVPPKALVVLMAGVFALVGAHSRFGFIALMVVWVALSVVLGRLAWSSRGTRPAEPLTKPATR